MFGLSPTQDEQDDRAALPGAVSQVIGKDDQYGISRVVVVLRHPQPGGAPKRCAASGRYRPGRCAAREWLTRSATGGARTLLHP